VERFAPVVPLPYHLAMTSFRPYPKVPASIDAWGLTDVAVRWTSRMRWAATEKIHGANLCICIEHERIAVAKRRAVLTGDEDFFDHRRVIGPLLGRFRALFDAVRLTRSTDAVLVYGELCGGGYPHPDIPEVSGVQPVQTGIHYAPDVCFLAFDVGLPLPDAGLELLRFAEALAHLERAAIPVVPVRCVGTLDEVLASSPTFPTAVPRSLGLPELPDNWAEGLVIKPSDAPPPGLRPFLKRKHPAFEETAYHEAQPWPRRPGAAAEPTALEQADALVQRMLTDQRIDSAISKLGRPTTSEQQRAVAAEVERDVREELEHQHGALVLALSPDDSALLWSVTADAIREAVSECIGPIRLDPSRYLVQLALAFVRGRLPEADASTPETLLAAAAAAGLRLHKFKRKEGPPRVTAVLSILEGLAPRSLLDIGSGRGAFLWPLLDRFAGLDVTAIDRLPHRVRDIEAVRAGGITRLDGILAEVGELPFDDDEFDVVTILEVLEHVEDPARAAAEVVRTARSFVVASVPSKPDDNPEHIRLFTADSLRALFESAGARRVQVSWVRNHMIAVARSGP
jgi:Rnl2 family RNA ligase